MKVWKSIHKIKVVIIIEIVNKLVLYKTKKIKI
jgi:hypothetical protein